MSRVPPTPVQILVDDHWIDGTVRTCEVSADGLTCSAVVSYGPPNCVTTRRLDASLMRSMSGEPGCPAAHLDQGCCA